MEPRTTVIEKRLSQIKKIIAVASGKGGVGKSMIATSLALYLSKKGHKVGLLDLDLYGPSTHIILGTKDVFPREEKGLVPPKTHGINFMSIVYFTEDKPAPFKGIDISNIILELLAITQWGSLDYLIIDMPPGLGEETLDVIRLIKRAEFIVVTTPSKVAMGSVDKLLKILKELKTPTIGIMENMTMAKNQFIRNEICHMKLKYLGSISFDHNLESTVGDVNKILRTDFMQDLSKIVEENNL